MKKLIIFILSSFALLIIFFSCEKDDNENDKTAPFISDIRINFKDTIMYNGVKYTFNRDSTATIDTLMPGHVIRFTARFQDNKEKGLSSYKIKLRYDSTTGSPNPPRVNAADTTIWLYNDSLLYVSESWKTIFGKKDTLIVDQSALYIRDSVSISNNNKYKEYPYREGLYFRTVGCVDKAGNETLVQDSVMLMYRETILSHIVP